ncbi:MAG: alpha/beta hydrolase-fold protein [Alphaproteobacteria bacterium]|nr:alpha/beta hydrolase-fold protein [Alphaproteobacteria bacterium]
MTGTKSASRWYSSRLEQDVNLARWGHFGQPVLLFPTAGGDAEEAERMHLIDALGDLIGAGRIKVYSCDSVAGRALAAKTGSIAHRWWLLKQFGEYVAYEAVPAIHADCGGNTTDVISAGASIGAFNTVSVLCRYPHLFSAAIGMSGSYDLERLFGLAGNEDYYFSAPICFLPNLDGGPLLDRLRSRFVLLTFGQGRWENPDDSWRMADILGAKGVPNRVDAWGPEHDHDWTTWRQMLPHYLDEIVPRGGA